MSWVGDAPCGLLPGGGRCLLLRDHLLCGQPLRFGLVVLAVLVAMRPHVVLVAVWLAALRAQQRSTCNETVGSIP